VVVVGTHAQWVRSASKSLAELTPSPPLPPQPSPVEQILDKDEYTLEELLDEDDIIQECKSLNGRLIAL
jgi:hypothetical protein